jgi:hypothetical protein
VHSTRGPRNGRVTGEARKWSFWWRSLLNLLTTYKGVSPAIFRVGDTIVFWIDLWNGKILNLDFPQLFSFAINSKIIVKKVVKTEKLIDKLTRCSGKNNLIFIK